MRPVAPGADDVDALREKGLLVSAPIRIRNELCFERPAWIFGHRLKNCTIGAFAYLNAAGSTSAYRVRFGRYAQIGESTILGAPEHPTDWFTTHPFGFTRPSHMPNMYAVPDFARLAPEESSEGRSFAEETPNETVVGHEVWIGAGSLVKRGVTIGDGAVIGACSLVTRDIPPYAVAVGTPAKVVRMRFAENLVERFIALAWWRYDLAPWKHSVDFSRVEQTLAFFEERKAVGELKHLQPDSYRLRDTREGLLAEKLEQPLFFSSSQDSPR